MRLDVSLDRNYSCDLCVEVKQAGWSTWKTFAKPATIEEGQEIVYHMTAMVPALELPGEYRLVRTETTIWSAAG